MARNSSARCRYRRARAPRSSAFGVPTRCAACLARLIASSFVTVPIPDSADAHLTMRRHENAWMDPPVPELVQRGGLYPDGGANPRKTAIRRNARGNDFVTKGELFSHSRPNK